MRKRAITSQLRYHRRRPGRNGPALPTTRMAAVFAGGILGSALRTVTGELITASPGRWPLATLTVNLTGALVLGTYLTRRQRAVTRLWSLHLWAIGMLGSLTTFSAFSVEVFDLSRGGHVLTACGYAAVSTFGGLAVAFAGGRLARGIS